MKTAWLILSTIAATVVWLVMVVSGIAFLGELTGNNYLGAVIFVALLALGSEHIIPVLKGGDR